MTTIYFVKDGKKPNGERLTRNNEISMDAAIKHLSQVGLKHCDNPPTFNPEIIASDFAPYRYVVLKVEENETNPPFKKPGYYYIPSLTPAECQKIFNLSGPME